MGGLALCLVAACDGGDGGEDGGGGDNDGGAVADGGMIDSDGSVGSDGGTPGTFVPAALVVGGSAGGSTLYAVDAELTTLMEISHEGAYVIDDDDGRHVLDVAADGRHVAYASTGAAPGVYVAPTDRSGGAVEVGQGADLARAAWAPDGSRLLFFTFDGASGTLTSVLPDGTGSVTLSSEATHFEWSPDSSRVLFTTLGAGGEPGGGAYVVGADGTGEVDLVAALSSEGVTSTFELRFGEPAAWSPDGTRIAIAGAVPRGDGFSHGNIYVLAPDGTGVVEVAADTTGEPLALFQGSNVSWAPDGSRIAFTTGDPEGGPQRLHTVAPDGSGHVTADADGLLLAWSPDSSHVALTNFGVVLLVASADTLVTTTLTTNSSHDFIGGSARAAWSPDSASLAYQSNEEATGVGAMELFVAAADGTNETKVSMPVTDIRGVAVDFFWSDDGERLFYRADEQVFEVPRPSSVAPEPVEGADHPTVSEQVRMAAEALLGDCPEPSMGPRIVIDRLGPLTAFIERTSPDVQDCYVVVYKCAEGADGVGRQAAVVCRNASTGRWMGHTTELDLDELGGIYHVAWR